ncbi:Enkurin domain-containing protein 1 [Cichlidogyrus casuarinus]|uniref:Enkurin domain-containing protein 1 n=1 Tax=Cichlidogyrus casuarinus TaxID=1844966 RepID=A0ABD2QCT0_9PLAT
MFMYPEALDLLHWENNNSSQIQKKKPTLCSNLDTSYCGNFDNIGATAKSSSAPKMRTKLNDQSKPSADGDETASEISHPIRSKTAGTSLNNLRVPKRNLQTPMETKLKPIHSLGQIPDYLVKKREDEARTMALREQQKLEGDVPAGHTRLPEEQRLETLELLKEAYATTLSQLNHLPLRSDTQHIRKKREDLEKRLVEIEENIDIFSKPKVFIRSDCEQEPSSSQKPKKNSSSYENTLG